MNNTVQPSTGRQKAVSYILLVIGAFIWGSAFIFQKQGMDYIGPLAFNGIRNIIGSAVLVPFILVSDKRKDKEILAKEKASGKFLIKAGESECLYGMNMPARLRNSASFRLCF